MSLPPCPQCASEYTYEDGGQYIKIGKKLWKFFILVQKK